LSYSALPNRPSSSEPAARVRGALYTSAVRASQQNDMMIRIFSSGGMMPLNLRENFR
jgi:hypothetical protein